MEGVARGLLNLFRELQNYVATAECAAFKRREREGEPLIAFCVVVVHCGDDITPSLENQV